MRYGSDGIWQLTLVVSSSCVRIYNRVSALVQWETRKLLEHAAATWGGGGNHTGNLAWELRPRKIILETDSMAAVQLLRGQLADKSGIAIVREGRRLLKMQWEPPDVILTILHEDMSCNGKPRLVVM
ncbi:hypothetical protein J1N35_018364 [Gossypium stocksii]|uniref:RNase H type-1 domain-containing protein n=1 Tax=Gossypium stocksii TaxID=47602 RepID=A0A9D3VPN0_9ROSI|nr:hypothetical protein J1N35_018364 [Gossypium stocksii]